MLPVSSLESRSQLIGPPKTIEMIEIEMYIQYVEIIHNTALFPFGCKLIGDKGKNCKFISDVDILPIIHHGDCLEGLGDIPEQMKRQLKS